jgi:glycosyltransferase involved in cell wall biosynthesis
MRVCQVLAGAEDGGLEKHTIELSSALKRQGVDVTVIAHEKYKKDFINVRFIAMDLTKSRNNLFILLQLYLVLRSKNFDIIHVQANKAASMLARLKPFLGIKVVATLHNYKKHLRPFYKMDHVITVSDRIGKNLHVTNKTTIYNGIEIEEIGNIDLHKTFKIPVECFIVCSIGRLVEAKGFDLLIKSLQYLDKNIYLLLIGDGPELRKLQNLISSLKLKSKIKFLGNLENKQTKQILSSSDLCVISSRREGFSYVFAESLLLDTPIVSTDVADIKKFIPTQCIVPFDSQEVGKKIDYFFQNKSSCLDNYDNVFQQAKKVFTVENMASQTIRVYQKVLS